jgi:hypothetical protein
MKRAKVRKLFSRSVSPSGRSEIESRAHFFGVRARWAALRFLGRVGSVNFRHRLERVCVVCRRTQAPARAQPLVEAEFARKKLTRRLDLALGAREK